jgi:hypothetical protein
LRKQPKSKDRKRRQEVEARASFDNGASVSRTFVAVILVIVAMGLAATGGYLARTVVGGGAATVATQSQDVHAAPGTVLRQDSPAKAAVELPGWAQREIEPKASPRIVVDDPAFISQYYTSTAQPERSTGHQELP